MHTLQCISWSPHATPEPRIACNQKSSTRSFISTNFELRGVGGCRGGARLGGSEVKKFVCETRHGRLESFGKRSRNERVGEQMGAREKTQR